MSFMAAWNRVGLDLRALASNPAEFLNTFHGFIVGVLVVFTACLVGTQLKAELCVIKRFFLELARWQDARAYKSCWDEWHASRAKAAPK